MTRAGEALARGCGRDVDAGDGVVAQEFVHPRRDERTRTSHFTGPVPIGGGHRECAVGAQCDHGGLINRATHGCGPGEPYLSWRQGLAAKYWAQG